MQDKIKITIRVESVPGNLRVFQSIDLIKTANTIILRNKNENDFDPVGVSWDIDEFDAMIELIKQNLERPVSNITGKVEFAKQHICLNDGSIIEPDSFHYSTKKKFLSGIVFVGEIVGELTTKPSLKIEIKELSHLSIVQEMIALTDRVMEKLGLEAPQTLDETMIHMVGSKSEPWFRVEEK